MNFLLRLVRVIVGIVDSRVGKRIAPLEKRVDELAKAGPTAAAAPVPNLGSALAEMEQKVVGLRADISALAESRISPSGLQAAFEEFLREEERDRAASGA